MRLLLLGLALVFLARPVHAAAPFLHAGELRLSGRLSGSAADGVLVLKTDPASRWEGLFGVGHVFSGGARGLEAGAGVRVLGHLGPLAPHLGAELWWMPYQTWDSGWAAPASTVRWDHAAVLMGTGGVRLDLASGVYVDGSLTMGRILNAAAGEVVANPEDPRDRDADIVLGAALSLGVPL